MHDLALSGAAAKQRLLGKAVLQDRHELRVDLHDIQMIARSDGANDFRRDGPRPRANLQYPPRTPCSAQRARQCPPQGTATWPNRAGRMILPAKLAEELAT